MYLVETIEGETEIVEDPSELQGAVVEAELDLLWSIDHGLRPADETAWSIGINCAAEVWAPLGDFLSGLRLWNAGPILRPSMIGEEFEGYDGFGWVDDPDVSQMLYEWSEAMEAAAADAGLIVESSADCGMTWCYRKV